MRPRKASPYGGCPHAATLCRRSRRRFYRFSCKIRGFIRKSVFQKSFACGGLGSQGFVAPSQFSWRGCGLLGGTRPRCGCFEKLKPPAGGAKKGSTIGRHYGGGPQPACDHAAWGPWRLGASPIWACFSRPHAGALDNSTCSVVGLGAGLPGAQHPLGACGSGPPARVLSFGLALARFCEF